MYQVLLVDDEDLIRESIRKRISWGELGYELTGSCRNGKEAIEFVRGQEVDVVITDICMPYLDGMELSRILHEEYPNVKIIIISGYDEFDYAKKAMRYKVVEYLLKPFTAVELSEALSKLKREMDEISLKQETIHKLRMENQRHLPLVRGQVLNDLMLWNKDAAEHKKELEELKIQLMESNMKVALIDFFAEEEEGTTLLRRSALTSFAVYNIAEELVQRFDGGLVFQGADNRVYILFQTSRPKEFKSRSEVICREIQEQVCLCLKLNVNIGLGVWVHELAGLNQSYVGAHKAVEYRFLFGECSVIDIETVAADDQISINQYLEELLVGIRANDTKEIFDVLQRLMEDFRKGYIDRNRILLYLQQCVLGIRTILVPTQLLQEQSFSQREESLMQAIGSQSYLKGAVMLLEEYCGQVAEAAAEGKAGSGYKMSIQAQNYIMNHYANTDLSLNMVCSELAISPSYFSSIYKNYTGETFLETLNRIRMTKAKELLTHTGMKNYEVAERVGFRDPHYFNIAFKKSTGRTPKEFAKESR